MEVKIEELQAKEVDFFWPVFSQIIKTGFPGYSSAVVDYFLSKIYTPQAFKQWLATGWKSILVAKKKAMIVGFAVLDKPYGGVSFCRWLAVVENSRRQGIGRKLISSWLALAKEKGCHKLEIASQPEAKDFYQQIGLELEGKRSLSYFAIDQFIFGKVIGRPSDQAMTKD